MENIIEEEGVSLNDMSLDQMDVYWDRAKAIYVSKQNIG